jgi:tryptophan synthase beta chain
MTIFSNYPDSDGFFGDYGGQYVSETLMPLITELNELFHNEIASPDFHQELAYYREHYIGRPSPLYHARRLSDYCGGAAIYFKRDELNHTGSHKINNCIGQILLARKMGKSRIIAETGAGQHGVATATVCALFGLSCTVYMGAKDIERQKANVYRMRLLGATVIPVSAGTATLKDAMNEALRDWVTHVDSTYYLIGTAAGPHPYPKMVRTFQAIIGDEVKTQSMARFGRLPDTLVACIGGGSNAIGLFSPFLDEPDVALIGVEAAGKGLETGEHAASLSKGSFGILHGNSTYIIQDSQGQIGHTHSISAGLDYPGIGPEHSFLNDKKRVYYDSCTDADALAAFQLCAQYEGIIPALEPSHALGFVLRYAPQKPTDHIIVMNLCGRGDKDIHTVAEALNITLV